MSKKLVTRAYNEFIVYEKSGTIKKKSTTQRLHNEMDYYYELDRSFKDLSLYFADVVDMKHSHVNVDAAVFDPSDLIHELTLQLYAYTDYGTQYIQNVLYCPVHEWENEYLDFLGHLTEVLRIFHKDFDHHHTEPRYLEDQMGYAREMFIEKTEREFFNFVRKYPELKRMLTDKGLHGYMNFLEIWPTVSTYIEEKMLTLAPVKHNHSIIHGDMCFSNMLYGPYPHKVLKFVDPRGQFGVKGIWGDKRYDFAKLYHSVEGLYEFIINDKFQLDDDDKPNFHLPHGVVEMTTKEFLGAFTSSKEQVREIMILSGTIFIGMCPFHYDSLDRQKAMYYTGIRQLNEAMEL